jgi:hypothetical protein
MLTALVWALILAAGDESPRGPGEIRGLVVNASQGRAPSTNTEVLLRVRQEGEFVPVEQAVTDAAGRFRFQGLPLGRQFLYLPGANRQDVHYPGTRIQLTGADPAAEVTLEVRDIVREPNPLVVRRHEILIRPQPGLLHVTESLRLGNPSEKTYVGRAAPDGTAGVTMRLSIPREFDRTTFFQEFYGRQFSIADGQLVTHIPWTPGERDLKFMYTIPNDHVQRAWKRTLDLPCENLLVQIVHDQPDEITCNLDPLRQKGHDERSFGSKGERLPAGFEVRVQLGRLPVPWTTYARWSALVLLVGLVAGTAILLRRKKRAGAAVPATTPAAVPFESAVRRRDTRRRRTAA